MKKFKPISLITHAMKFLICHFSSSKFACPYYVYVDKIK